MATTMRIAELAERSGFSPATLRYYEQVDLLPDPPRTAAGYRSYDESVLDRLAFIARAKALGCSLEEIARLMPDWDGGRCPPVQDRLRDLVTGKLGEARRRAVELSAFTADLERMLAGLGDHTPDGPCDTACGCVTDVPPEPVACSLAPAELPGRVEEWREVASRAVGRTPVDGGIRLQFAPGAPLDRLALLVGAEQGCCSFFSFAITVDRRGPALEIRAPAEGRAMVDALFGAPAT
jgi:DNA-binding transcriptional MerR regulator